MVEGGAVNLNGWSLLKADMMGKPHLGARYTVPPRRYERLSENCMVCGRPAANCHHLMPLGNGRSFTLRTDRGTWTLHSPLMALCGSGTTGCHGLFHSGVLAARWFWRSQTDEDRWWSGELLEAYGPHSLELYRHGGWGVLDRKHGGELSYHGDDVPETLPDALRDAIGSGSVTYTW